MDAFSYLSVLISIILGLGVAQVLTGLGRIIQDRHRVRFYWPALVWAGLVLLFLVQTWWVLFGMRSNGAWTFGDFLVVLVQPSVLYLLAALVLPSDFGGADIDLRANYYRQAPWFFSIAVVVLVQSLARDLVLTGRLPDRLNLTAHILFGALWTTAALTRRESYHRFLAPCTAVLFALYVAALFARLR